MLFSNEGNVLLRIAVYLSSCDCLLESCILVLCDTHSAVNSDHAHAHAPSYLISFLVQFDNSIEFQSNFNLQLGLV